MGYAVHPRRPSYKALPRDQIKKWWGKSGFPRSVDTTLWSGTAFDGGSLKTEFSQSASEAGFTLSSHTGGPTGSFTRLTTVGDDALEELRWDASAAGKSAHDGSNDYFAFWVRCSNAKAFGSNDFSVFVGSGGGGYTNYYRQYLTQGGTQDLIIGEEWLLYLVPLTGFDGATGGSPSKTTLEDVKFRVSDNSNAGVTLDIAGAFFVQKDTRRFPNGAISMVADDSRKSQHDHMASLLDGSTPKINGTYYSYPGLFDSSVTSGGEAIFTTAEAKAVRDTHGSEITFHANTVDMTSAGYAGLSSGELEREMIDGRNLLQDDGFNTMNVAYVRGEFAINGINSLPTVRKHAKSGRTIFKKTGETLPVSDPYRLRAMSVQSADTLATITGWIDDVIAEGGWAIIAMHTIVTSPDSLVNNNDYWKLNSDNANSLEGIRDHIITKESGGTFVGTVEEVLAKMGGQLNYPDGVEAGD